MQVVFFDLETGGVAESAPIIQIAATAIDMETFEEIGEFEQKVKFDPSICEKEALEVNHYDPAIWAERAEDLLPSLIRFVSFLEKYKCKTMMSKRGKPYRIAIAGGHNISSFDLPRLQAACSRENLFLPLAYSPVLDTLHLCWADQLLNGKRSKLSDVKNFKLSTVAEALGIETENAHDALADVRMSIKIARVLGFNGEE